MLKVAILAAVECRISDLQELFKDNELQKYWKLIINSIPESLNIDQYVNVIPRPTYIKGNNELKYEKTEFFDSGLILFNDTLESIVEWSILRCYQIIKYTFNIEGLALPFLTSMIKHIGLELFDCKKFSSSNQNFYLLKNYEIVSLLYSFHSILVQYCIFRKINKDFQYFHVNPVDFVLETPINRFKMIINCCVEFSQLRIEDTLLEYFSSYSSINYINLLNKKKLKKQSINITYEKCEPFINKHEFLDQFEFSKYSNMTNLGEQENIFNCIMINRNNSFEEIIIDYLQTEIKYIPTEFFLNFTKILITKSNPIRRIDERLITCPMKVLQIIILSINGTYSPLLNVKALEIQDYMDEIYECIPKSFLIIKQINKPFIIEKFVFLENALNEHNDYIRCPFCKKPSVKYISSNSKIEYKNWLKAIHLAIEFHEKQQLIIDLFKIFPLKFIRNIKIVELTKTILSPNLIECFFIRLVKKIPSIYVNGIIKTFFSLYRIIKDITTLPNYPFGNILTTLFYLLKTFVFFQGKIDIEAAYDEIIKIFYKLNNSEFKDLIFDGFKRFLDEDLTDINISNRLLFFVNKLCISLESMNDFEPLPYLKAIKESILISKISMELLKFKLSKEVVDSKLLYLLSTKDLEEIKNINIYDNYEFKYKNPNEILLESNKLKIISELYLSNPSLSIISDESELSHKVASIIKIVLEDEHMVGNYINMFKIVTLTAYMYEKLSIKLLIGSIGKNDTLNEIYHIAFLMMKKHTNCEASCPNILHILLKDLEKKIIQFFPLKFLGMYLNHKSRSKYDKFCTLDLPGILETLKESFFATYSCKYEIPITSNQDYIHNLYFAANFINFKQDENQESVVMEKINIYDLLIHCSADLLLFKGNKAKQIFSSINIDIKTKRYISKAILDLISIEELYPKNIKLIEFIRTFHQIIGAYERLYKTILAKKHDYQDEIEKILFKEGEIPIYLLSSNSTEWLERWKLMFKVITIDDIIPLINSLDLIYSNNQQKIPLIVSLELFQLVQKAYFNLEYKQVHLYPKFSRYHIDIMNNYLIYSTKVIVDYYKTYISEGNLRAIFIRLLIIILSSLSLNKTEYIKEVTEISKGLNNIELFRILFLVRTAIPKIDLSLFEEAFNEKITLFLNEINYSYVWNHYWTIFKIFQCCLNDDYFLSIFSYKILFHAFFIEKKFLKYKSLINKNGKAISYILYDLLKHLATNTQETLKFINHFSSTNKHRYDIINLLINIFERKDNLQNLKYESKLLDDLNLLILFTKICDYFPDFKKRYCQDFAFTSKCYKAIGVFCLDLFLKNRAEDLNILIKKVLLPMNYSYFKILYDAIILYIENFKIIFESDIQELKGFLLTLINTFLLNQKTFTSELNSVNFILNIFSHFLIGDNVAPNEKITFIALSYAIMELNNIINYDIMKMLIIKISKNIDKIFSFKSIFNPGDFKLYLEGIFNAIKTLSIINSQKRFLIIHDLFCELLHLKEFVKSFTQSNTFLMLMSENNANTDARFNCILSQFQEIVSEFVLEIFLYIINSGHFSIIQIISLWYLFGISLLNDNHKIKFSNDMLERKLFSIGLISPIRKSILTCLTYFRIEEILTNKYYNQLTDRSISNLIDGIHIILSGNSCMLLGTYFFSEIIIPLIIYSKIDTKYDFIFLGKYICNKLNIRTPIGITEISMIGVFFKILIIFRKYIILLLILQLIDLKSYKIAGEIITLEMNLIRNSSLSIKYILRNLLKFFEESKFLYFKLDNFFEIQNNPTFHNKFAFDDCSYMLINQLFILRSSRESFLEEKIPEFVFNYLIIKYNSFFFDKSGIYYSEQGAGAKNERLLEAIRKVQSYVATHIGKKFV